MFQRYFDAGLAQASYLIACTRTREAMVIDPRRDIEAYIGAAAQHGLEIVAAIETHIHADFVSGARELAAVGAQTITGPGASLEHPAREVQHDERLVIGDLVLRFLHTPGHTPEHISVLAAQPGQPVRVFTGDTLFAGAVGRPDLLGDAAMRHLAAALHHSLFGTLLQLDDEVEVHPGHGAGSLCGAGIGTEPFTTIGRERRTNPMLAYTDRDRFIAAVLGDLPDTPSYFARMKRVNREGPAVLGLAKGYRCVREISPDAAALAIAEGAIMIDLRTADAFCAAHAPGALNMAFGSKVGYWAGWVLPEAGHVVLMTDDHPQAHEVGRQLLRVGIDDVDGYVPGIDSWRAAGLPIAHVTLVSPQQLRELIKQGNDLALLDVRSEHEWSAGHIADAVHVPMGEVTARAAEFARYQSVATICEGGYRSMLAASLLARAGLRNVLNVAGGMTAFRSAPS